MDKERIDQIQEQTNRILHTIIRFADQYNLGKLKLESYKDPHKKLIADLCNSISSIANESLVINDVLRLEKNLNQLEDLFSAFQIIGLELDYDILG